MSILMCETSVIYKSYNIERMAIDLDFDKYRRKGDRTLKESTVIPYAKLRGPERHHMNRAVSCLN